MERESHCRHQEPFTCSFTKWDRKRWQAERRQGTGPAKWTGCGEGPSKGEETGHRDSKREEVPKCSDRQLSSCVTQPGWWWQSSLGGEGVFTLPTGLQKSHKLFCSCGWWRRGPASKQASDPFSQEEEFSEKTRQEHRPELAGSPSWRLTQV